MSDVPSNLIPTRITQLPTAPVADENSLMMIVYQGSNYQIRVGDLLSVSGVPLTRQVIAGTGMTGGGQLSSNVTLSIAPGGVGTSELSNTGVTPGFYGSSLRVPVMQVDAQGRIASATTAAIASSAGGTVYSVGLALPVEFNVSGSPIDDTGTLTGTWANQVANYIFAAPNGSGGVPTFRAMVNADVPAALSSKALTASTVDSSVVGGVTPAAGTFTDLTANYLQLNTAAAASIAIAKLRWNVDTATAAFGIIDGTEEVNIGQQMFALVTNADSVTITRGQPVYLYAATGNRASVKLAANTGDATSAKTLGLAVQSISPGNTGFVITQGVLDKLDTSAFAEGATLYLGATAGTLTSTKPQAPNHLVYIGVVERANAGNGQIYVRTQNGYELDEIHDVQINSPANGQTIIYDAATSLWKNANLTAGTGISITDGASSITIASTTAGTVTSVDVSGGTTGLTTTGGPVTASGTITLAGTLATGNGGTGLTTYTAGDLPYYAAGTALSKLTLGAQGQVLRAGASAPEWAGIDGGVF